MQRPRRHDYWQPVETLGSDRFPDLYGGLALVPGGIEVYRKPSEDFDREARALGLSVRLFLRDVAHSARELAALADQITADLRYWQAEGVAIHTWGPRPELGAVEVRTSDPDTARRLLPLRYGSLPPIVVVEGGAVVPC